MTRLSRWLVWAALCTLGDGVHLPRPGVCRTARCSRAMLSGAAGPRSVSALGAGLHARLEVAHARALSVPCPFWRRRFTDGVEALQQVVSFVWSRHKSLPLGLARPSNAPAKRDGLTLAELASVLETDFGVRRAYVTGRLTRAVYAEDCFFDGPDPDMPVRGVRKYCLAVSGLFDAPSSACTLAGAPLVDEAAGAIICHWRLSGRLHLPWRPAFKPYLGYTTYTVDPATGLISTAVEAWSVHPAAAFLSVLAPALVRMVPSAPEVGSLDEWLRAWEEAGAARPPHLGTAWSSLRELL